MPSTKRQLFSRLLTVLLTVLLLSVVTVAPVAPVGASGVEPTLSPLIASRPTLTFHGGAILLTATVTNAATCTFTVRPAVRGGTRRIACSSGTVRDRVVIPPNTLKVNRAYTIRLTATGAGGSAVAVRRVVVAAFGAVVTPAVTIPVPAQPDAFVQAGADIWVASCQGNAVTEINKNTKQIIQTLTNVSNPNYGFNCPDALAFDGTNIWVANKFGNSLTLFDESTGVWGKTLTGSSISAPDALTFDGNHVWVANNNSDGSSPPLSIFYAPNGQIFKSVNNTIMHSLSTPTCLTFDGTNIWVADSSSAGAFEYSASSGKYLRSTGAGGGGSSATNCVSYHSGYIWISSGNTGTVLEFNATNGAYVREINVYNPNQLVFTGSDLFVVRGTPTDAVVEYNSIGRPVRNIVELNYRIGNDMPILYDGTNLWVANERDSSVTAYSL